MKSKRKSKLIKTLIIIFSIIIVLFTAFLIYTLDYYHAQNVDNYLVSNETVEVTKEKDYYYFNSSSDSALIFYPGGKVEYTAYAPLMYEFAENGISCFLLKMPFNLAMFGINKADYIINNYDYDNWYLSGHSLGGVFGSEYVYKNQDKFKGVLFLGSYTTKNFSNSSLKFLSLYGEFDNVLNKEKYNDAKSNLPTNLFKEVIIEGGNHANYGFYGNQKKDGTSTITNLEQIDKTVYEFKNYFILNR